MNSKQCEQIQIALMAHADGEAADLPVTQIHAHLAECAECRGAAETMQSLSTLLSQQTRRVHQADLWGTIEPQVCPQRASAEMEPAVPIGGAVTALLTGQILLCLVAPATGWWIKAAMILAVVGWLMKNRLNPFAIETNLVVPPRSDS